MANADPKGNELATEPVRKSKAQNAMDKAKVFIIKKTDLEQLEREGPKLRSVLRKEASGDLKQASGNMSNVDSLKLKFLNNVQKIKQTPNTTKTEVNPLSKSNLKISKPTSKLSSENPSAATSKKSSSSKFNETVSNKVTKTKTKPTTSTNAKEIKSSSGRPSQSKLKTQTQTKAPPPDTVSGTSAAKSVIAKPATHPPAKRTDTASLKLSNAVDTNKGVVKEGAPCMTGQGQPSIVNTNKGVFKTVRTKKVQPSSPSEFMYQKNVQNKKESSLFLKDNSPQTTANVSRHQAFEIQDGVLKPRYNHQVPIPAKPPGHSIKDNTKPQGDLLTIVNSSKQSFSSQNQRRR